MKSHEVSKMASGIMGKKRSYPNDAKEESAESPEVEKDEQDAGDFDGMSIDKAQNGYSVHVRGKSTDGPASNSQGYVFGHDHPVHSHISAILKHTKHKK